MEWVPLGEAWIARGVSPEAAAALARNPPETVLEAWAAGSSVGVILAPDARPGDVEWPEVKSVAATTHTLRIRYDGPDLEGVAENLGFSVAEVIRRHLAPEYLCAAIGFCPGFGYLEGLDPALELPRRASPRTRVPPGAVAIAGSRTTVYPLERPGGWHLIGSTDEPMVHVGEGFCRLKAGDRVRFVRAG